MADRVDWNSSPEEKNAFVRQAVMRLRSTIDHDTDMFYTRNRAGLIFCEHCQQQEWARDLTVLNRDNGKKVIVRFWWHNETRMQRAFRIYDEGSHTWTETPITGDALSELIRLLDD